MINKFAFLIIICLSAVEYSLAQQQADLDSLKQEILALRADVQAIKLDMAIGGKKFKRGILVATIGYSVTIAGGLMLDRKHDDVGKVLLVTGGATGIIGTVMMLDSFKYLGRPYRRNANSGRIPK